MEKQKYIVKIDEEDSKLIQKKQYEFNAKASIVSFLAQDKAIDWDFIQDEINSAEVAGVELDLAKAIITKKTIKENNLDIDLQYFNWQLDFFEHEITFLQSISHVPNVISTVIKDMEEDDVKELEKKQYEYNSGVSILSFMKESIGTNPKVIEEYHKVIVQRLVELEETKAKLANKYNTDKLDLNKYNWNVDFIDKTITFSEVD